MYAKKTPSKHNTTLKITFIVARKYSESLIRLKVSREKVEKVVNPPQKPIVRNNLDCWLINSFSSKTKITNPITKLPSIFTASVP